MEQPEYTKTPRGLARDPGGSERAPRKAKCIPVAGNRNKLYENSLNDLLALYSTTLKIVVH